MEKVSKNSKIAVAAIDLGTTFSGCAFSLKYNWGTVVTATWTGGPLFTYKAPTCLLLKKDYKQYYFGYEAEDIYIELTSKDRHSDYYFFQRFKMILHQDLTVKRHITCNDITGKPLEASLVFEYCIRYLKQCLQQMIEKYYPSLNVSDDDIEYVLTVPAVWGDKAKLFMREAAVKAGIKRENLTIVLEAEAASIYCQYLEFAKKDTSSRVLGVVKPGNKYMMVDLGGGTADITVHQKCEDNTLEEVIPASGRPWGEKAVDEQFIKFLSELVGEKVWEKFKLDDTESYLEITRVFETKKRTITTHKSGSIRMRIPQALVRLCTESHRVKTFKEVIEKNYAHTSHVDFCMGKLVLNNEFFMGFFQKTIDEIIKQIEEFFREVDVMDVKVIVMVGGFSDCEVVRDAIMKHFKFACTVIVPEESDLAVLKGAVFFGHVPDAISRRSARYTYGIETWPKFSERYHPKEKMVEIGKSVRCRDVFFKIITKGEKFVPSYMKSRISQALHNEESLLGCGVFFSDKKNPKFVDDPECRLLGYIQVPLFAEKRTVEMIFEETLIFGETDLKIKTNTYYDAGVEENFRKTHLADKKDLPSYRMDRKPRGIAVIINNLKFFMMPDRTGTDIDADNLTNIFQKLHFIVRRHDNLKDDEIRARLADVSQEDHSNYDCFVCCILSHGRLHEIYGTNCKPVGIAELTGKFRSRNCKGLAGKPKLFFIQACQGTEKQLGNDIEMDSDIELDNGRKSEVIPDDADFVLGYATVPGYVSCRSRSEGSLFINKLVDMLDKFAHRYDLLSILVKVNEEVSRTDVWLEGGFFKQIPAPVVTLRKKLFFW